MKKNIIETRVVAMIVLFITTLSFFTKYDTGFACDDRYLTFWFPLYEEMIIFIFSVFIANNTIKNSNDVVDRLVTIPFVFLTLFNLICILLPIKLNFYLSFCYGIITVTIFLLSIIQVYKFLMNKK